MHLLPLGTNRQRELRCFFQCPNDLPIRDDADHRVAMNARQRDRPVATEFDDHLAPPDPSMRMDRQMIVRIHPKFGLPPPHGTHLVP